MSLIAKPNFSGLKNRIVRINPRRKHEAFLFVLVMLSLKTAPFYAESLWILKHASADTDVISAEHQNN